MPGGDTPLTLASLLWLGNRVSYARFAEAARHTPGCRLTRTCVPGDLSRYRQPGDLRLGPASQVRLVLRR